MFKEILDINPSINIRVVREDNGKVVWTGHNIITNTVKQLFARLMANIVTGDAKFPNLQGHEPLFGIWGLALGAGDPSWAPETQPAETSSQTALIAQFLRKPLSRVTYVDVNLNPQNNLSLSVDFQTVVNATTDNITQSIREMGLIGGGTAAAAYGGPSNMLLAPYFDPTPNAPNNNPNTVTLINYKTLPPLILPPGVNFIFSWVLNF